VALHENCRQGKKIILSFQIIFFGLISYFFSAEVLAELYLSPCEMNIDPAQDHSEVAACLEGSIGLWAEQRSRVENDLQPPSVFGAKGQLTILPASWIVLQGSGHHKIWRDRQSSMITQRDSQADSMVVQIGNNALHRHRILGGRMPPPIGLNIDYLENFRDSSLTKNFYGAPLYLGGYTYDNQKDVVWTIVGGAASHKEDASEGRQATVATRISYDLAALEGTRLSAAFLSSEPTQRTGVVSILNRNSKGETTSLEVVRTWSFYPYDPADFHQLIRLNWSGKTSPDVSIKFQYEDVAQYQRIGSLTTIYSIFDPVNIQATIGYSRSESELTKTHWLGILGVEAKI
jgi:hypothetical protein